MNKLEPQSITSVLNTFIDNMMPVLSGKDVTVRSGIAKIDEYVPIQKHKPTRIAICGEYGSGKTSLTLSFLKGYLAQGYKILYIACNTSSSDFMERFLSITSGIPIAKLKQSILTPQDINTLTHVCESLYASSLYLFDCVRITYSELLKAVQEYAFDIVIIDDADIYGDTWIDSSNQIDAISIPIIHTRTEPRSSFLQKAIQQNTGISETRIWIESTFTHENCIEDESVVNIEIYNTGVSAIKCFELNRDDNTSRIFDRQYPWFDA